MSSRDDDLQQIRLARNQAIFREVNECVERLQEAFGADGPVGFLCECSRADCTVLIELAREDYERVREHPDRFLIVPDHSSPDVERVVETNEGWIVIEKLDAARAVAVATDPRGS